MSLLPLPKTRDDEEALIKPLSSSPTYNFPLTRTDQDEIDRSQAHSTLTFALPSVKHSANQLETTLSPSKPVCLKKKALLIGIQNYGSMNTDGQLKGPHADVRHMQQLLLGQDFRHYSFSRVF
jgi:Caspase domain